VTHTLAILPVNRRTYDQLRRLMILGGREDAIRGEGDREEIDMSGIALQRLWRPQPRAPRRRGKV